MILKHLEEGEILLYGLTYFLENNNIFSPYNDEDHLLYINLFLFKNETTTLTQQIFPIDSIYHSSNMIQQFLYYYKYIHHNNNSTRDFFSLCPIIPPSIAHRMICLPWLWCFLLVLVLQYFMNSEAIVWSFMIIKNLFALLQLDAFVMMRCHFKAMTLDRHADTHNNSSSSTACSKMIGHAGH